MGKKRRHKNKKKKWSEDHQRALDMKAKPQEWKRANLCAKCHDLLDNDWYAELCSEAEQEAYDALANSQRQTKKEKREVNRHRFKKEHPIGDSIGSTLNSLNHLIDQDLSFHGDRHGRIISVIHYGLGVERHYMSLYDCPITDEKSVYRTLTESYQIEDSVMQNFDYKAFREQRLNYDRGKWYHTSTYPLPQLMFMEGGAVTVGSDRLHDCVHANISGENCLITKEEHIVEAPAILGLGFGSYTLGHHLLFKLRNHWRMRGKLYARQR